MEEEKKKNIKKKSNLIKIGLGLGLILLALLIIPDTRESIVGIFIKPERELELLNTINIEADTKRVDLYHENILKLKENSLEFLDYSGVISHKKDLKLKNPDLLIGKENFYVFDKVSGQINILDENAEIIETISLKEEFYKLEEEGENLLIHRKDEDKNSETIDVIDKKAKTLKSYENSMPILSFTIKDEEINYLVASLDVSKDLKSTVSAYSKDDKELYFLEIKDEIVIHSEFIKNNLLIFTDQAIYFLDKDEIKWQKKYKDLKDIKLVEKEILLLQGDKFQRLSLRGRVKEEIDIEEDLEKILPAGKDIILYGKNNITIAAKKKNLLDFKLQEDLLDLRYEDGNLFVFKEDKLERYKIKNKGE